MIRLRRSVVAETLSGNNTGTDATKEALVRTTTLAPSDGIYEATPDYAHGIEVTDISRFVFVAGTMGLDPRGKPGADLSSQLTQIWANIARILAEAEMTVDNVVRVTSYLTNAEQAAANGAARVAALAGRIVPTTAIVVQTLSPDWLVEVEVIAAG